MKVRICSDLHTDVNTTTNFGFTSKLNEVDVNIIAGDIAGDYFTETTFLKSLNTSTPIICVAGNHLGYNHLYSNDGEFTNEQIGTKDYSLDKLTCLFTGPIYYLNNNSVTINDKIIFGGTMYTDFKLYGDSNLYGSYSEVLLNDFRYVYIKDKDKVRLVRYEDYIQMFIQFKNELRETINKTKSENKDIIVVTHFAPSKRSISRKYMGKYKNLNPSYASDLEDFITSNPRIKLWVHGHMHDSFDYKIGNCRVVCCPFGYYHESTITPEQYNGKIIRLK